MIKFLSFSDIQILQKIQPASQTISFIQKMIKSFNKNVNEKTDYLENYS